MPASIDTQRCRWNHKISIHHGLLAWLEQLVIGIVLPNNGVTCTTTSLVALRIEPGTNATMRTVAGDDVANPVVLQNLRSRRPHPHPKQRITRCRSPGSRHRRSRQRAR